MLNPVKSAKDAGLKYVTDHESGIKRKIHGKSFTYEDEITHKIIHDKKILLRIKQLVIPPAWKDVWICKNPNGHLQVTGRDAKNRKQYRYHENGLTSEMPPNLII